MNEWVSLTIAFAALLVSVLVAWSNLRRQRRDERTAKVTAYFHHLGYYAQIARDDVEIGRAGYHLVIWNQGPAAARNVSLRIYDRTGQELPLLACSPEEFPLSVIDSSGRYPIPWVAPPEGNPRERQYQVTLTWTDENGHQRKELPLRRGRTGA